MVLWRTIVDLGKRSATAAAIADRLGRGRGHWRFIDRFSAVPAPTPHRPDLSRWDSYPLAAAWVGHATVLIRFAGKTILTDPVLSARVGVGLGFATAGPARLIAPALAIEDLPPIDLILLSHAHFDHLDRPTLARLPCSAHVITTARTRDLLDDLGFASVTELQWGQEKRFDDLLVRAWEVNHWGARTFHDQHRTACAFVLEDGQHRLVFGGDSAFGHHFRGIRSADLAILGIGAYNPWIMGHADPEQAWQMAQDMRAEHILPMHHSTFRLSREPMNEPLDRFHSAAGHASDRLVATEIGQLWTPR